jgi:hypothetical protein
MERNAAGLGFALLLALAACRPGLHGQCNTTADCRSGMVCLPAGICSTLPPTITVFVPPAPDAVEGWVPRTDDNLEVRAQVDDGAGSGAASATLTFDVCPAAAACSYAGTAISTDQGVTTFSFQVPRKSQAAGAEAPLAITVKGTDKAGNEGKASGVLQIDDAPPHIGAFTLVTAGIQGEDGNTWFVGGAGAPPVEIAVPVTDLGVGVASLSLAMEVPAPPVPGIQATDGTWHFNLPASLMRRGEGQLRFSLTATDKLQHTSTIPPGNSTAIWVDDLPPTVTAPAVNYSSAMPAGACGPPDSANFKCGRQGGTFLLRDDSATVSFDVTDCGVGVGPALPAATVTSGGQSKPASPSIAGVRASSCSNQTHRYTFALDLVALAPKLDAPDGTGGAVVHTAAAAADRLGHSNASSDGPVYVSLWRWKRQVAGSITGSPALLFAASGPRSLVVGTDAGGPNLFAIGPDGSEQWKAALGSPLGGDVALGSDGSTVYAISPGGNLYIVSSQGTVTQTCTATGATFGAPPAIANISGDAAIVAATATGTLTDPNLFAFQRGTSSCNNKLTPKTLTVRLTGASAGAGDVFVSHGNGFSSFDAITLGSEVDYNGGGTLPTLAPPSVSGIAHATAWAVFGTAATADQSVRRTYSQGQMLPCTALSPCWQTVSNFTPAVATSGLPTTPVFDGTTIYTADDKGTVYSWSWSSGTPVPPGWPVPPSSSSITVSPPVLLEGGGVLVVYSDGKVKIIGSGGTPQQQSIGSLLEGATPPLAPVIDQRTLGGSPGGVAYVAASGGWIYAWQIAAAPKMASTTVWPRPGHDSCNSRNASTSSSVCP